MSKKIVAIDIGTYNIKLVVLEKKREDYVITNVLIDPRDVVKDLKDYLIELKRKKFFSRKSIITSVSGQAVIVRYLWIDQIEDHMIRKHIFAEADKYIPFDINDVILDCQVVGKKLEEKKINGMLVAVKKDYIKDKLTPFLDAKLIPEIVDVDQFAIGNAFIFLERGNNEYMNKVFLLLDIGESKSCINIVDNFNSVFSREFYVSGQELTESIANHFNKSIDEARNIKENPPDQIEIVTEAITQPLEEIAEEVSISIEYFENTYHKEIDGIFLTGGSSLYPDISSRLESLTEKTVKVWNPLEKIRLDIKEQKDRILTNGPAMAVVLGLSSRIEDI